MTGPAGDLHSTFTVIAPDTQNLCLTAEEKQRVGERKNWQKQQLENKKPRQKGGSVCGVWEGREGDDTQGENGKEGEIVPDLDLRGSGPSDVSIS